MEDKMSINFFKKIFFFFIILSSIPLIFNPQYLLAYPDGNGNNKLSLPGGSSSYVVRASADQTDLKLGTGDFVVEFWFRPRTTPTNPGDQMTLVNNVGGGSGTTGNPYTIFIKNDSGTIKLSSWVFNSGYINATSAISQNNWYHVAFSRASNTIYLYFNGNKEGTPLSNSSDISPTGPFYIGAEDPNGTLSNFFNGAIEEFRIRKGTAGVYNGADSPGTPSGDFTCNTDTTALWHFNETAGSGGPFADTADGTGGCGGTVNDSLNRPGGSTVTTLITLASFKAIPVDKKIVLKWETGSEEHNAGFYILRSESKDGGYARINSQLIHGKGDSVSGWTYSFTDENVEAGKLYFYKLEDIDIKGTSTMHEPVSASFGEIAILSPDDGKSFNKGLLPDFKWRKEGFAKFKFQLSTSPDFAQGDNTLTISKGEKNLGKQASLKLGKKSLQWLRTKAKDNTIYWRIIGENSNGKKSLSEVRTFSLK